MEFNNILRELNYYLAELYIGDIGYTTTRRIITGAGLNPQFISSFQKKSVDTWFEILDYARVRNPEKVTALLSSVLKEPDASDDEFIKGAIKALLEQKDVAKGVEIKKDAWKEPVYPEAVKEKIIGRKSTILPIGFLKKGMRSAMAVVRIVIGPKLGTGFIIKNNWLLTNNHVISSIAEAGNTTIEFNYEFPDNVSGNSVVDLKAEKTATLDPGQTEDDKRFFTSKTEDWTLVKIKDDVSIYGALDLSTKEVAAEDYVNIIQHPSGGPKQVAIYNNMVMYVDNAADGFIVQYLTDTMPGSSGSPVLNSDWEVVALHHSGGWVKDPNISTPVYRNQGTNIKRIAGFMKEKGLLN